MIQSQGILRAPFVTAEEQPLVVQQGMERVLVTECELLQLLVIVVEAAINPVAQSRTRIIRHANPSYVTKY
jgi:hypothetical protein